MKAKEILNNKESYDFLKGAKRVRVRVAMQKFSNQQLSELKEKIKKVETHFIGNETVGYKTYVELENVLELIEEELD